MASFAEMVADCYFWLGTTASNQAFPAAQVKRCLNLAKDALVTDAIRTNPDAFQVERTLTSTTRSYDLTTMSPAIRDVHMIVEVRLTDRTGTLLGETRYSELERRTGVPLYAAVGPNVGLTIVTSRSVTEGADLYFSYVPMAADLSGDGDTVTLIPSNFHDVISLMGAKIASGSGNEQALSPIYMELLADRQAQLWQHLGQRSIDNVIRRTR